MDNCKELFMVRRISAGFVALVILIHILMTTALNLWAFPQGVFNPLHLATHGLVSATLQANLCMILVMFILLCLIGKLSFTDLGLHWKKIPAALLITAIIWLIMNGLLWIAHTSSNEMPTVMIEAGQVVPLIGNLLGQLLGNAFYEETIFRGFLLVQVTLILKKTKRKWGWGRCLFTALLVSQIIFALIHVPNRIYKEVYDSPAAFAKDQLMLVVAGVYFAALWLLSRNLFLAIGIHSLSNAPTTLFDMQNHQWVLAIFLVLLVGLIIWNRFFIGRKSTPR